MIEPTKRYVPLGKFGRVLILIAILAIAVRILLPEAERERDPNQTDTDSNSTSETVADWIEISGNTMGSTYRLLFAMPTGTSSESNQLADELRQLIQSFEDRLSTWREDTELSLFNASSSTDWYAIDAQTLAMIELAKEIHAIDDRFDVTLTPLSSLWGFGPSGKTSSEPKPADIDECLLHVGMNKLETRREPPALRKLDPRVQVDLSALAAGYVADRLAERLTRSGVIHCYLDVAGEIVVRGLNRQGQLWRVGIAEPVVDSSSVHSVLQQTDCGIATSGNYRKYIEIDGQRMGHILDPRTGYPAASDVLSATVIEVSCARADAIATLLMTMSADEGLRLAQEHSWKAILLVRDRDGAIQEQKSFR